MRGVTWRRGDGVRAQGVHAVLPGFIGSFHVCFEFLAWQWATRFTDHAGPRGFVFIGPSMAPASERHFSSRSRSWQRLLQNKIKTPSCVCALMRGSVTRTFTPSAVSISGPENQHHSDRGKKKQKQKTRGLLFFCFVFLQDPEIDTRP